jgi:hypothetical protein
LQGVDADELHSIKVKTQLDSSVPR